MKSSDSRHSSKSKSAGSLSLSSNSDSAQKARNAADLDEERRRSLLAEKVRVESRLRILTQVLDMK